MDDGLKFGKMPTFFSKPVWGVFVVQAGLVSNDVVIECELGGFEGFVGDYGDREFGCVDGVVVSWFLVGF